MLMRALVAAMLIGSVLANRVAYADGNATSAPSSSRPIALDTPTSLPSGGRNPRPYTVMLAVYLPVNAVLLAAWRVPEFLFG